MISDLLKYIQRLFAIVCTFTFFVSFLHLPQASAQDVPTITVYGRTSGLTVMKEIEGELGVRFIGLPAEDMEAGNVAAVEGDVLVLLWGSSGRGGGGRGGRGAGGGRGSSAGRGRERGNRGSGGGAAERGDGNDDGKQSTPLADFIFKVLDAKPKLRVIATGGTFAGMEESSPLVTGFIEADETIDSYTSQEMTTPENLHRLARYLAIKYAGRPGEIQPPKKTSIVGLYHPDSEDYFESADEYITWSRQRGVAVEIAPRILVLSTHVFFASRNRKAILAMVDEIEQRGGLAAIAMTDKQETRPIITDFKPDVVIDAMHRGGELQWNRNLGVPHFQGLWVSSRQTVDDWLADDSRMQNMMGLTAGEANGVIEPHVLSGRTERIDGVEYYVAIEDRIERVVARAMSWAKLHRASNDSKRIAMMHAGGGGADLNHPASIRSLLTKMREAGYVVDDLPESDHELLEMLETYGSQIDVAEPHKLDSLARSGRATLVPLKQYQQWFAERIPQPQQQEMIERWGEAPGNIMAWTDDAGEQFLVIPTITLGNVLLVGKPHPQSAMEGIESYQQRKNERGNPPSHNILATYFWLEEEYKADAVVVWGALSIDLLLPKKSVGLSQHDWPDILWGSMPNIRPFGLGSLTFAIPAKRRTTSVLIDHLPPATVPAELDDELQNLSNDLLKWQTLSDGALKDRFLKSITQQVRDLKLDIDLKISLDDSRTLTGDEMASMAAYLTELQNERIPLNSHVLGHPVRGDLVAPYIVACLGSRFVDSLAKVYPNEAMPAGIPSQRDRATEIVETMIRQKLSPADALTAVGAKFDAEAPPEDIIEALTTAQLLADGLLDPSAEIDNILAALDGRFIEPGPGHLPTRNPAAVPTGRNIVPLNPEEIPSQPSWELGRQLVDDLLAKKFKADGKYPDRIAYSLSTRGTMSDFGVMEAQILYTLGVRPVWSFGNRVTGVELIPADELGRPRIDVFIEPKHYYADYLTSRLELIDSAIRLVAETDEANNRVAENTARIRQQLLDDGVAEDEAELFANARIFATAPDRFGSGLYDGLFEETGVWDNPEQLTDIYISQHDFMYTTGAWGQKAPEAYRQQLRGTDIVLRSLNRKGALGGRAYMSGGTLCMVAKVLTGEAPEFLLADLRNAGDEQILTAHDALRKDFRTQLFNRQWIASRKEMDRRGAGSIAAHVWRTLGYSITVDDSVDPDIWKEVVNVYLRDSKNMDLPQWFDSTNPEAFQELNKTLLEAIRKGYWNADDATKREVAEVYAKSVKRHGLNSPHRNQKLESFVEDVLNSAERQELAAAFLATVAAPPEAVTETSEAAEVANAESTSPPESREAGDPNPPNEQIADTTETVQGQRMESVDGGTSSGHWPWIIGIGVVLLIAVGIVRRSGAAQ